MFGQTSSLHKELGGQKKGVGKGSPLTTGGPWGPESSEAPPGAERAAVPLLPGGRSPQAAKGATRQKANYKSKDPSPAYREVAQHKTYPGT